MLLHENREPTMFWTGLRGLGASLLLALTLLGSSEALAHSGHSNPVMWEVCKEAAVGDECRFVDAHDQLNIGTCRNLGGHTACVRHRPLQPATTPEPGFEGSTGYPALAGVSALAVLGAIVARLRRGAGRPLRR